MAKFIKITRVTFPTNTKTKQFEEFWINPHYIKEIREVTIEGQRYTRINTTDRCINVKETPEMINRQTN